MRAFWGSTGGVKGNHKEHLVGTLFHTHTHPNAGSLFLLEHQGNQQTADIQTLVVWQAYL